MQSSNRITLNSGFRSSAGVSRYKKKQVVDELSQHQAKLEMLQAENAQLGETVDRLEEEL
jgi:cell division protein FtsB